MKLWRISNYKDLKGIGGLKTPGRWHNRGIPVVYLAESPALAMLEVLVHMELAADDVPDTYQLLEIEYTGRKGIQNLNTDKLTDNWQQDTNITRSIGDEWLATTHGALLKVPSAIVPHSNNYLFNPRSEHASLASVISVTAYPFDSRLCAD